MQYANLGRTGLKVSRICLGAMTYGSSKWRPWVLDEEVSRPFIQRALEMGINFFDTADMYSRGASEEVLGRALRDFTRREEVVIATKVYFPMGESPNQRGLSRLHILRAVEDSLKRLGTEYIDLYQIHRWDSTTPIEETLEALHDLVKSGKVRYIGASSMYAWQFARSLYLADLHGWTRFVSMQNHYNLVYREEEREMLPLCRAEGVGIIPWSPLARGFLAGNRRPADYGDTRRAKTDDFAQSMYYQETDFEVVGRVVEFAKQRDASAAQIALAWLLHQEGVTAPIIGASKMEHLEQAVGAVDIELSAEDRRTLEEPYQPHTVLGHN
ncbi:MAG TPA: aldo/keto reductase [Anaerolineales bacterium]|nr:aldo/keto reductase [Anaerolineales bacterium]